MKFKILTPILATFLTILSTASAQNYMSSIRRDYMDLSIDPGTDFYNYAAGQWIKSLPNKPESARYNQFDILQEQNEERLISIITSTAHSNNPKGSINQKIGDFYTLYMDSTRRNKEGAAPLMPYLQMIKKATTKEQLFELAAKLSTLGFSDLFMNTGALIDMMNASQNIVVLYQGGLTLSSHYYIANDSATVKIRKKYIEYIENIFQLAGFNKETAITKRQAVIEIETKIAQKSYSNVELRNVKKNYHNVKFDELYTLYPGVNWHKYFEAQGFPKFTNINVGQPEAIKNIINIFCNENIDKLKAYTEFKVISSAADFLSDDFVKESFKLSQAITGVEEDKPRWKKAVNTINSYFGMALGKLYVEKYFPESSKQTVLQMVYNIQNALKQKMQTILWMSDSTKAKAIDKLESFHIKIGYPNKWIDYTSLSIDKRKSLLDNRASVCKFKYETLIDSKVNQPVDSDEWHMTPQTINAYYSPTSNEITFPAAILQPPFFDPEADEAYNYGGIGCVIGHEMTHGFDDQGCNFDKNGNFTNWWTDSDRKQFNKRAKVMEKYFDGLEVLHGEHVNGKLTLGENIADNGGIKISFMALSNILKDKDLDTKDGFTPQQRFFISYAFIWAGVIRPEEQRSRLKTDPHSPMNLRVNGQLPHLQPWYDAFGITKKSPMYIPPQKRADIW